MIVKRVVSVFKVGGVAGVLSAAVRRIRTPHARSFPQCRAMVSGWTGIEIWGPALSLGGFVAEGSDLRVISSGKYDFVLSSNMLERTANPLRGLAKWRRLLKPAGALVLVPARYGALDHRRPIATMSHLVEDYEMGMGEDDRTHLEEILKVHDLSRDPEVTDISMFRERAERDAEFRSIHHHVFDTRLAVNAVFHAGFELVTVERLRPYHTVVLARKLLKGVAPSPFDELALREALRTRPFQSDRQRA